MAKATVVGHVAPVGECIFYVLGKVYSNYEKYDYLNRVALLLLCYVAIGRTCKRTNYVVYY